MIDNFSVSSLKLLEKSPVDFKNKYDLGMSFNLQNKEAKLGNALHKLIYYKIKNFDIAKIERVATSDVAQIWEKVKNSAYLSENFIDVEKSFFAKMNFKNHEFYLNGRFDAVAKEGERLVIIDWKTNKVPSEPQNDLQSVVYLYCASKLYETKNLAIKYVALSTLQSVLVEYEDENAYVARINAVVSNYFK